MKGLSITRGIDIFRIKSDTFWLKYFVSTILKIIFEGIFETGVCKVNPLLGNLGCNSNSTQNQNVFQLTVRNVLGISSINSTFSNVAANSYN